MASHQGNIHAMTSATGETWLSVAGCFLDRQRLPTTGRPRHRSRVWVRPHSSSVLWKALPAMPFVVGKELLLGATWHLLQGHHGTRWRCYPAWAPVPPTSPTILPVRKRGAWGLCTVRCPWRRPMAGCGALLSSFEEISNGLLGVNSLVSDLSTVEMPWHDLAHQSRTARRARQVTSQGFLVTSQHSPVSPWPAKFEAQPAPPGAARVCQGRGGEDTLAVRPGVLVVGSTCSSSRRYTSRIESAMIVT